MKITYHKKVEPFIRGLQPMTQARVIRAILLVEHYGLFLGMPHTKKITNILYELRIRGQQEVRIFYTIQEDTVFLVHGFIKKTQKTPKKEIETAQKRVQGMIDKI